MQAVTHDIDSEAEHRLVVMKLAKEMSKIADRYPRRLDTTPGTPGFVYIIRAESTNLYKIGLTRTHVRYRLQSLKTSSPFQLELVAAVRTANPEATEKTVHDFLSAHRANGEWFELDEKLIRDALRVLHRRARTPRNV